MDEKILCNNCGRQNPAEAKFCSACGKELSVVENITSPTSKQCPECKTLNDLDATCCEQCGRKIDSEQEDMTTPPIFFTMTKQKYIYAGIAISLFLVWILWGYLLPKLEERRHMESIEIVKNFMLKDSLKLPESLSNIGNSTKPQTIREYFSRLPFLSVVFWGIIVNKIYAQAGRYESIDETTQKFADEMISRGHTGDLFSTRWDSQRLEFKVYKVSIITKNYMVYGSDAFSLYSQGLTFVDSKHDIQDYSFKVDLREKTLQPLNMNAWQVIDLAGASKHLNILIEKGNEADVSNIAPDYPSIE